MSPEQIEVERKAFEAHTRGTWKVPSSYLDWALKRNERGDYLDGRAADQWSGWLARAEKAQRVREALGALDARLRECLKAPISAAEAYDSFYQEMVADALKD